MQFILQIVNDDEQETVMIHKEIKTGVEAQNWIDYYTRLYDPERRHRAVEYQSRLLEKSPPFPITGSW